MVSDLDLEISENNSVGIIDLRGQVDLSNSHLLREAIDDQLSKGKQSIVIITKNLNFIDSSCLGVLVSALRKVNESNGRLALVVNAYVERLVTVSGLRPLFETHDTLDEAVASVSKGNSTQEKP